MKEYWKSLEEKNGISIADKTPQKSPHDISLMDLLDRKTNASRRNFLKFFGYSIGTAAIAASCERPVTKAIPYLVKPEEVIPGKANYYASTFFDGLEYNSILVKVRDGRPIKIEGNDLSPISKGSTTANVQASVLSLYDDSRQKNPTINKTETDWETIDKEILSELNNISNRQGRIVLLTPTIISPSTHKVINTFLARYNGAEHIVYDSSSYSGMLDANQLCFGKRIVPAYSFDKAELIVSVGADFLGTWLSPLEFTKQYSKARRITDTRKTMARHIQIETGMSLTGTNADQRIPVKPSAVGAILGTIYNQLASQLGEGRVNIPECKLDVTPIVNELLQHRNRSLIVSGSNDPFIQVLVNGINTLLGNYGNTIDLENPIHYRSGDDSKMNALLNDMEAGSIDALLTYDVNPVYDHPQAALFANSLSKVGLTVSLSGVTDETTELMQYVCPDHHYLESWNDAHPKKGHYSLAQPAIRKIFKTRQFQDTLLTWSGESMPYLDFIKQYWKENIYPETGSSEPFERFWDQSLHDGVVMITPPVSAQPQFIKGALEMAARTIDSPQKEGIELELYESVALRNGKHANNPWLQEMPDPVSKVTWDNYLAVSPRFAEENGLEHGDVVTINDTLEAPVILQPGQAYNTFSLALGYGRKVAGKVAVGVGVNANPLSKVTDGYRKNYSTSITWEKTGSDFQLAQTQTHHSMEGRALVRETTLEKYLEDPASGNEMHEKIKHHHTSLYPEREFKGHHWGMAIDLSSCTGCSACLISCSAENNVPVVGKNEVARAHEMHWIRLDRYYSGDPENPEVLRQPVMCQHCDNAPCENVCPVAATNSSSEGINQMAYNRCIGTRYCNNNCPYKVRRFNFYDYTNADALPGNTLDPSGMTMDLKQLVLNPDVTVRAKGVIEKCSFCVQRIQAHKLNAKLENRTLKDGEIKTACQQACPADAIVFGDLKDENSRVSKLFNNPRNYHLLEEIHTLPSVGYLTKIRNKTEEV